MQPVRARAIEAASGTTDFGEYFLYFSFFLVVSGLLLTGLFFRVGVEQRLREVGLLEAIGLTPAAVRGLFLREGLGLALVGSLIGLAGALGYAALIMLGLRTWWVGAVGTTALVLRPSVSTLAVGLVAGVLTALLVIWWTLRQVTRASARELLKGAIEVTRQSGSPGGREGGTAVSLRRRTGLRAVLMLVLTALLLRWQGEAASTRRQASSAPPRRPRRRAVRARVVVARRPSRPTPCVSGHGPGARRIGNASVRPGRSVLSVALIAFAAFVVVSVGAFRREGGVSTSDPATGKRRLHAPRRIGGAADVRPGDAAGPRRLRPRFARDGAGPRRCPRRSLPAAPG